MNLVYNHGTTGEQFYVASRESAEWLLDLTNAVRRVDKWQGTISLSSGESFPLEGWDGGKIYVNHRDGRKSDQASLVVDNHSDQDIKILNLKVWGTSEGANMDIRKADSKGRVIVGIEGVSYQVVSNEDGSKTLYPIQIPTPPHLDNQALRALYWEPASRPSQPDRIYIHSVIGGSIKSNAEWVARITNELLIPVVVTSTGVGAAATDYLIQSKLVDREVISVK